MRNVKSKRTLNFKLFLGLVLLLLLALLVLIGFLKKRETNGNLDYKLGIIANDGIALVSISNERKMVNVLNLGSEVEIWIPFGMSWYGNTNIKNVLEQEKNGEPAAAKALADENIFWYNFGFLTDKILVLNSVNDWKKDSVLIDNLGFWNWLKYRINYDKMLLKEERIDSSLDQNELYLSEIMVRDFSESRLNNEDLRLSIFNNTNESGLANFIAKRLEWSGFSVVSADNNEAKIDRCLIVYGDKVDLSYGWKMINQVLNCDKKYNQSLNENEVELYFGDNFASMIQYPSYLKRN
ncbi:MAG: LytR C-terminal domain-containing protein [Candidatus Shapirobacteria bacterium]|nr:LytR C-terminal domain-containing protein [Candidatus Shapirobacteria bacterium]